MTPARGVAVLAAALVWAVAARAAEPPAATPDLEMLRDLDMLTSPSYTRDRELGRKLGILERLRMLEGLRQMEGEAVPATRPAGSAPQTPSGAPTPKEVK
jgi:hypothetical protein